MTREKISHCSTRHAEERTSRETIEETGNDHSLDVLRNGARDQPDQEKGKRYDVDVSPSIKLDLVSMACVAEARSRRNILQIGDLGTMVRHLYIPRSAKIANTNESFDSPRPKMKNDRPNVATSREQWNSLIICSYVMVYIDEVHVLPQYQSPGRFVASRTILDLNPTYTQTEPVEQMTTINHLRSLFILRGFAGSFSSQVTVKSDTPSSAGTAPASSSLSSSSAPIPLQLYPSFIDQLRSSDLRDVRECVFCTAKSPLRPLLLAVVALSGSYAFSGSPFCPSSISLALT